MCQGGIVVTMVSVHSCHHLRVHSSYAGRLPPVITHQDTHRYKYNTYRSNTTRCHEGINKSNLLKLSIIFNTNLVWKKSSSIEIKLYFNTKQGFIIFCFSESEIHSPYFMGNIRHSSTTHTYITRPVGERHWLSQQRRRRELRNPIGTREQYAAKSPDI